jgi:ribonuclease III
MEIFGYTFQNAALLEEALTVPSYRMNHPEVQDNQRLEFLGDAVLELLATDQVYAQCPDEQEGPLTVRRTHMVSTAALCAAADRLGLVPRLRVNPKAPKFSKNSKIVADALEAVMGAAWLDGGFDAARQIFAALDLNAHANDRNLSTNPKGELQIRAQALTPPRKPVYTILNQTGPQHLPTFTVKVEVDGIGAETSQAHNLREAEASAAAKLLKEFPS